MMVGRNTGIELNATLQLKNMHYSKSVGKLYSKNTKRSVCSELRRAVSGRFKETSRSFCKYSSTIVPKWTEPLHKRFHTSLIPALTYVIEDRKTTYRCNVALRVCHCLEDLA